MTRKIIHLDLDAFYCAVEEQRDPSLRGKPFAVGGRPNQRGVVASCSYAARKFGVRSAMPMRRALQLCPELLIVSPHFKEYRATSRRVMAILHDMTPLVEQISIDEAFLDVTELSQPAEELARRLQKRIREKLDLPCSLGVASNKLVAKIGTDVGKAGRSAAGYPNAVQVVPPGEEAQFLAPLPAETLWGVGPKTAARLAALGIRTIGDIAAWPQEDLARRFGQVGRDLARRAQGIDQRPVEIVHEAKSISQEVTFSRDVSDESKLRGTLRAQSESIGKRLRKANLSGTTIKLKLRWPDFTTITRQTSLGQPTDQDEAIYQAALSLFLQNWKKGALVRLIGVGVSGLQAPTRQLSLWDTVEIQKQDRLQEVVEQLRQRYGEDVLHRGGDLNPS